jgi:hypothetical protein
MITYLQYCYEFTTTNLIALTAPVMISKVEQEQKNMQVTTYNNENGHD